MKFYTKIAPVEATQATEDGHCLTLENKEPLFYKAGDYICGPGYAGEFWPVRKDIFEATHVLASSIRPFACYIEDAKGNKEMLTFTEGAELECVVDAYNESKWRKDDCKPYKVVYLYKEMNYETR